MAETAARTLNALSPRLALGGQELHFTGQREELGAACKACKALLACGRPVPAVCTALRASSIYRIAAMPHCQGVHVQVTLYIGNLSEEWQAVEQLRRT